MTLEPTSPAVLVASRPRDRSLIFPSESVPCAARRSTQVTQTWEHRHAWTHARAGTGAAPSLEPGSRGEAPGSPASAPAPWGCLARAARPARPKRVHGQAGSQRSQRPQRPRGRGPACALTVSSSLLGPGARRPLGSHHCPLSHLRTSLTQALARGLHVLVQRSLWNWEAGWTCDIRQVPGPLGPSVSSPWQNGAGSQT